MFYANYFVPIWPTILFLLRRTSTSSCSCREMNTSITNDLQTIKTVWFRGGRIFIQTNLDKEYSRPLEAFPVLLEASDEERKRFKIGKFGDDIRWDNLDEDIHISSFFVKQEPNTDNIIAETFRQLPWLNVSEVARYIGINKSLLSRYIYGIKKPSEKRINDILSAIREMGQKMTSI